MSALRAYGLPRLPVVRADPPVVAGEVAGSVSDVALLDALVTGNAQPEDLVAGHIGEPLPTVGAGEPLTAAVAELADGPVVLVLQDGKPTGVLSTDVLLAALAER